MQTQQAFQLIPYPFKKYTKDIHTPLYVVKDPPSPAKVRVLGGCQINITIISDRIPRYNRYNQQFVIAMQQGNSIKTNKIRNDVRRDLQNRLTWLLPNTHVQISDTLGVWKEGLEQSFQISFSNFTDDIMYAMVKIAENFDQDAVHFIRPVQEFEVTRPLGILDDKGTMFTSVWEFTLTNPLTVREFQKIIGQCGLPGAQLSKNGKIITIYNSYDAEQSATEEAAASATIKWENKAINFAKKLQQRGVKKTTIGFAEFRSYGRDPHSATRAYTELECYILPGKRYQQRITNLLPITSINWLFKKMDKNHLNNPVTKRGHKALAKMIRLQYANIPIRVYAWATPIQQADGSIRWQDNSTQPYKDSAAMKYDVVNNNRLLFYTTAAGLGDADIDYTHLPLLEMTEFYTNPQQVRDEEGKLVYIDGKPKMAQYQLNLGDTLHILHHLKHCAA